ncbi:metallophosphoesterase [Halococcus saccharolyticus]|uniref:Phosphoesterase n=1 Tax=Halococcus saccharolyticus DSM 5350 TaxID=1227455 RepID=M0MD73_9EURY|nr:metallophosphoesterase [Halococcus saccharolyticus]EMA43686.1 phosphodiesterase [Halococcus saccharolyticus DSM 5350]
MIVALADTHGTDGHCLNDRLLETVRAADLVVHAGDLTTEAVLDAFAAECREFVAVHGNNATPAVRDRLPAERVVEHEGVRIALTHGDDRDETGLSLFGRQNHADLVISGHSHRPGVVDTGECTLLNPGSHADPRWNRPGYAEIVTDAGSDLDGRLRDPDGTVFEEFRAST